MLPRVRKEMTFRYPSPWLVKNYIIFQMRINIMRKNLFFKGFFFFCLTNFCIKDII